MVVVNKVYSWFAFYEIVDTSVIRFSGNGLWWIFVL